MPETTELVKYIPDYSIVRLPDGKAGYVTRNTGSGRPIVRVKKPSNPHRPQDEASRLFPVNGSSLEVDPDDVLEILHFPVELAARWLRAAAPEERTRQALVITTFPEHITSDDEGREVASVMGCDWEWRTPPTGTVVVAVRPRYGFPAGTAVAIEAPGWERPLWYDATAIRLLPLEPGRGGGFRKT
jgi:hypothetical protein